MFFSSSINLTADFIISSSVFNDCENSKPSDSGLSLVGKLLVNALLSHGFMGVFKLLILI